MPENEIEQLREMIINDNAFGSPVAKTLLLNLENKIAALRAEVLEYESEANDLPAGTLYETEKNELLQQMHTNLTLEELTNLVNIAKGSKKNWK